MHNGFQLPEIRGISLPPDAWKHQNSKIAIVIFRSYRDLRKEKNICPKYGNTFVIYANL